MTSDSNTEAQSADLLAWLEAHKVKVAPKQWMIDAGLNVFGFDLAMESFHRHPHKNAMPEVFAYEHEDGVLVFVKRPQEQRHD